MPAGSDQQQHWDAIYGTHEEFFGIGPSEFEVRAATVLEAAKVHVAEDMWQNSMGFVVHFFSADKVRRLASGYDLLWMQEFEDPSPPFTKKLYDVALRKAAA